ncbi:cytochrome C oxidase subunit IV family protein [Thermus thermamylovorans]|uniref:Cytochrome C oxidase subunit IV n=1 Tax=Thermus thermamylovorans TaxID=2509362 RepID=A0A4V2IV15_9DEIN|nr:cytochrome C oxidase subunit IV family protein [Thermus thermamylovorans]TBH20466.1 cytochrome C oxidase subunit IV [Thermus thermamylovorans]
MERGSGMARGEQHQSIGVYLAVWGLLFVLSAISYLLDYFQVEPIGLRRFLITVFALLKAGLIVAYFMHLRFERLGLVYAILLPPLLLLALVAILVPEGRYVAAVRQLFFGGP